MKFSTLLELGLPVYTDYSSATHRKKIQKTGKQMTDAVTSFSTFFGHLQLGVMQ
jgi:hypothetical protein